MPGKQAVQVDYPKGRMLNSCPIGVRTTGRRFKDAFANILKEETDMTQRVAGVFAREHEAVSAIDALKARGIDSTDISVIGKNSGEIDAIATDTETKVGAGMATGAATGGVIGGTAGLLAGLGAIAIPGIGPFLAAGPIVAVLAGAVVGAGTGTLVGGLVGLGFTEDEAVEYSDYVDEGHILVLVDENETRVPIIEDVFRRHGSLNTIRYASEEGLNAR
jgi:hypothetical protein